MSSHINLSTAALETKAIRDFRAHLGETVMVRRILITQKGRTEYRTLSTPAMVTVSNSPDKDVLKFATRDLLSPVWCVVIAQSHPEIPEGAVLNVHGMQFAANGRAHAGDVMTRAGDYFGRASLGFVRQGVRAITKMALHVVGGELQRQ